ncbi:MAG: DUF3396 domain-containing protein [Polyangiaceae bacterium]
MTLRFNDYLQEHPVRVALVASFFSAPSDANAAQAAGVYERFAERYGDKASFFSDAETDRVRRLDARSIAYPRRRWAKAKDGLLWKVSTTLDQEVPGEWNFTASLRAPTDKTLSFIWFSLDHAAVRADAFRSLFLETARDLECKHGYGGLGIVAAPHPLAAQESEESAIAITARFHGFDVLGAHRVSIDATDGIKCVNWLTLVDAPLLAELGGERHSDPPSAVRLSFMTFPTASSSKPGSVPWRATHMAPTSSPPTAKSRGRSSRSLRRDPSGGFAPWSTSSGTPASGASGSFRGQNGHREQSAWSAHQ